MIDQHDLPHDNLPGLFPPATPAAGNRALNMLKEADLEPDEDRRRSLLTFVVVGGGSTGVEVAAQLNDLLRHAARSFGLQRLRPRVLLVHSRNLLLPSFGARGRGLAVPAGRRLHSAG